ncbi:hypothetical protein BCR33DRAFT_715231 [Rhizoclosmatium globosum]|uniref:RING-type domain-containing protein n=1 Tax=Rhizoclosmatium globosum TaxID=329046 RepID=A0A1Y2CIC8_9FUNG|nr:hypothetical protein BCR33DRAFT_715231 [Rhizoclosmatium globosum]|eukprot:ORY46800.1 hypothetical protein BCR33DRAFT_715231 [Rhizoclosmatium globosum]
MNQPPSSQTFTHLRTASYIQQSQLRSQLSLAAIPVRQSTPSPPLRRSPPPRAPSTTTVPTDFEFEYIYVHSEDCQCGWGVGTLVPETTANNTVCHFPHPDLTCPLCFSVFRRIRQTKCCKKVVCVACIHRWTCHSIPPRSAVLHNSRSMGSCPFCRSSMVSEQVLEPLLDVQRDLDSLLVACPFGLDSSATESCCGWIGSRGSLREHLKTECQGVRVHFKQDAQVDQILAYMEPGETVDTCMHPFCIRLRERSLMMQQQQQALGMNGLYLHPAANNQVVVRRPIQGIPLFLAHLLQDWGVPMGPFVARMDIQMDVPEFMDFERPPVGVRYVRAILLNLALFATYLMVLMLFWKVLTEL